MRIRIKNSVLHNSLLIFNISRCKKTKYIGIRNLASLKSISPYDDEVADFFYNRPKKSSQKCEQITNVEQNAHLVGQNKKAQTPVITRI